MPRPKSIARGYTGAQGVRRRRAALAGVAAVALVVGVLAGAGAGGEPALRRPAGTPDATPPPAPDASALAAARRLPLEQRVGGLVIMRFAGNPEPAYVRRALREGRAAGVILFKDNAPTHEATRAMTRRLQRAAGGNAIVCTDQEGGSIRTLLFAAPEAGQAALATPAAAAAAARAAAGDLRAAGVNVNLGPVADVAFPGSLMRGRAFPGGPAEVSSSVLAAVRAYRGSGVAPTVKHFPGLGAADVNTDDAAVVLARSPAQLVTWELAPFQAAIRAGAPVVMLSHALYPALDADRIASQSPAVVRDLLRGRLGFRGVAMTDSLEAEAVTALSGPGRAAVRSVRAGVDLILTTGPGSHLRVVRALLREARRSPSFEARVTESAARVIALQRGLVAAR